MACMEGGRFGDDPSTAAGSSSTAASGRCRRTRRSEEDADARNPFPTTFHPRASDIANATVIRLGAGQRVPDANIFLPAASPTRKLRIVLEWKGHDSTVYRTPSLFGEVGRITDVTGLADDALEIDVVTSATYRIKAYAMCRLGTVWLETNPVEVDGADASTSQVKLTFNGNGCSGDGRK